MISHITKLLSFSFLFFFLGKVSAQNNTLNIGETAPEIISQTINEKPFQLSSLKGKVILLDFWASWCAPCIEEQPELLEIYREYKNEVENGNFQIVGFSLDNKKESWEKTINRFQIPWTQISDLKFWKSPVVKNYRISELPYNLILNENKDIIAINIHGNELKEFLKKLLIK